MFIAVLMWVRGEEFSEVKHRIERGRALSSDPHKRFNSFRTFKDKLAWKARFLAIVLQASANPFPVDERQLYQLELRVRIGCRVEAVPLFHWRQSGLTRQQGNALVASGYTAGQILGASLPSPPIKQIEHSQWNLLRDDLERLAKHSLLELAEAWTQRPSRDDDPDREAILGLWNDLTATAFPTAVDAFRVREAAPPAALLDEPLREHVANLTRPLRWSLRGSDTPGRPAAHVHRASTATGSLRTTTSSKRIRRLRRSCLPTCRDSFGISSINPTTHWCGRRSTSILSSRSSIVPGGWRAGPGSGRRSRPCSTRSAGEHLIIVPLPWKPFQCPS